jgi:hypothetical protein
VEIRKYSIESLEGDLREFEARFGMSSERFFDAYRTDEVPVGIPGFEGFVWADKYQEACRLRSGSTANRAQLA